MWSMLQDYVMCWVSLHNCVRVATVNVLKKSKDGLRYRKAALDAIIIYISVKNSLTGPKSPHTMGAVRWRISWGVPAEDRTGGDSIDVRDPSSLETVPQNRDVSGWYLTGLEPPAVASLLL